MNENSGEFSFSGSRWSPARTIYFPVHSCQICITHLSVKWISRTALIKFSPLNVVTMATPAYRRWKTAAFPIKMEKQKYSSTVQSVEAGALKITTLNLHLRRNLLSCLDCSSVCLLEHRKLFHLYFLTWLLKQTNSIQLVTNTVEGGATKQQPMRPNWQL